MGAQYCIGVDIGGTSVKLGLFTVTGALMDKWEIPTRKDEEGKWIIPDIAASIKKKMAEKGMQDTDLAGIGMGVPGPIEPDGHVAVCVNLGWKDRYPAKELSSELGGKIRAVAGNDANVAALGEMWQGGGKGHTSLVAVTLGTGVGGGVILNSRIVTGTHGLAGEIGHMHIREEEKEFCNCGGQGCLEQVASATGIVREAKRNLANTEIPSKMREFGDALTAKDVCDCAKEGDALALGTLEACCRYLGWALALVTQIIDPEIYVIGGGVSKAGQILIDLITKYFNQFTPLLKKKPEIALATLGNDAGIYGAARQVLGD